MPEWTNDHDGTRHPAGRLVPPGLLAPLLSGGGAAPRPHTGANGPRAQQAAHRRAGQRRIRIVCHLRRQTRPPTLRSDCIRVVTRHRYMTRPVRLTTGHSRSASSRQRSGEPAERKQGRETTMSSPTCGRKPWRRSTSVMLGRSRRWGNTSGRGSRDTSAQPGRTAPWSLSATPRTRTQAASPVLPRTSAVTAARVSAPRSPSARCTTPDPPPVQDPDASQVNHLTAMVASVTKPALPTRRVRP